MGKMKWIFQYDEGNQLIVVERYGNVDEH
jgi:hypothetical protein